MPISGLGMTTLLGGFRLWPVRILPAVESRFVPCFSSQWAYRFACQTRLVNTPQTHLKSGGTSGMTSGDIRSVDHAPIRSGTPRAIPPGCNRPQCLQSGTQDGQSILRYFFHRPMQVDSKRKASPLSRETGLEKQRPLNRGGGVGGGGTTRDRHLQGGRWDSTPDSRLVPKSSKGWEKKGFETFAVRGQIAHARPPTPKSSTVTRFPPLRERPPACVPCRGTLPWPQVATAGGYLGSPPPRATNPEGIVYFDRDRT
jgi:hypothetical protein